MQITGLKLLGFKSFVEPSELIITTGLTGVVGPNGCGKSNLLEALRWVMGETSYKAMRGGAMDDVIFSGTQNRPARNFAEVGLIVDNSDRLAPAEFNGEDRLEIIRRIDRGEGSTYRVNGREVRARDIKLLFEDAATGARSHALVRQGQIGEIVNSKPQARRRILEDAAGIAGLHSRRHESELRLKAAEDNLARLGDVMGQVEAQMNNLRRQARQALRYKELSTDIHQLQALAFHLKWSQAGQNVERAEIKLQAIIKSLGIATQAESQALIKQEEISEALPPLRQNEAFAASALSRLTIETENFDKEQARLEARLEELDALIRETEQDLMRDELLIREGEDALKRLAEERNETESLQASQQQQMASLESHGLKARQIVASQEQVLSEITNQLATRNARQQSLEHSLSTEQGKLKRFIEQQQTLETEHRNLSATSPSTDNQDALSSQISHLEQQLTAKEKECLQAEEQRRAADSHLQDLREQSAAALLTANKHKTEMDLLKNLLAIDEEEQFPPILDLVEVDEGYELALGAALGDELAAALEEGAPLFWRHITRDNLPALPANIPALSTYVRAPEAVSSRLSQIGLVNMEDGERLQQVLAPGQRLVSKSGQLWRWDGLTTGQDRPSASAKRLSERNRLASLERECTEALAASLLADRHKKQALEDFQKSEQAENQIRQAIVALSKDRDQRRERLRHRELAEQENIKRFAALEEGLNHLNNNIALSEQQISEAQSALKQLDDGLELQQNLNDQQQKLAVSRVQLQDAELALSSAKQALIVATQRLEKMATEETSWQERTSQAVTHIQSLKQRLEKANAEKNSYRDLPEQRKQLHQSLMNKIADAEVKRNQAADRLQSQENLLRQQNEQVKTCQLELMGMREDRARLETRLEATEEQRQAIIKEIGELFQCQAEDCLAIAEWQKDTPLPELQVVETRLTKLKAERERLGAVNLRADDEIDKLEAQFGDMGRERDDLEQAISKLRQGINNLNQEGRGRLLAAFDQVNDHFQRLFSTLFGGGKAELQLIESEDPLEAGLEIVAQPPGKKPQVLTLLSGGEKALTAMSLIFAVFLTNPSPICVLDEVDAPLDDSNVDRFCTLLEEMKATTNTRFLVITHHPMTMARMNRLFGVTMAEKGVSQLVSVDLTTAEGIREAS